MCISRKICIDIINGPHSRLGSCVRNTDGLPHNVTWPDTVLLTASHLTACEFGKQTTPVRADFVSLPTDCAVVFLRRTALRQRNQPHSGWVCMICSRPLCTLLLERPHSDSISSFLKIR